MFAVLGEERGFGGFGEGVFFLGAAGGLAAFEFGGFAFAAAGEAIFLEIQIAQFLFVTAADFEFAAGIGFGCVVAGIVLDEFQAAGSEDGEFEAGDLVETPADVGDGLDEGAFFGADGLKFGFVRIDVQDIFAAFLGGEEEQGFAGEAGFDGVEAGFGLTLGGGWSVGFLGVLAVSSETSF